jgi:S-adenosylmethionine decarboxylase
MNTMSKHLLIELSGCHFNLLNDLNFVKDTMRKAALEANAEVLELAFHKFSPQGISGVVVISESHLSIHTWPEYGYAAIDIFTCGDNTMPEKASKYLKEKFQAKNIYGTNITRGILKNNIYVHRI